MGPELSDFAMKHVTSWKAYGQRSKVLNLARDLARSGQHADHRSIIAHIELVGDFADVRDRLVDRAIRSQLDRLCLLAQASPVRKHPRAASLRADSASSHAASASRANLPSP